MNRVPMELQMDLSNLNGKNFAILMIAETNGEEDWAYFGGIAKWDGKQLIVDRGPENKPFPVPEHTFDRIKPVDEKLRQVFEHADYYVPLLIGPLPEDADLNEYIATGMFWPKGEDTEAGGEANKKNP
jgi:hypothetical protein